MTLPDRNKAIAQYICGWKKVVPLYVFKDEPKDREEGYILVPPNRPIRFLPVGCIGWSDDPELVALAGDKEGHYYGVGGSLAPEVPDYFRSEASALDAIRAITPKMIEGLGMTPMKSRREAHGVALEYGMKMGPLGWTCSITTLTNATTLCGAVAPILPQAISNALITLLEVEPWLVTGEEP